MVDLSQKLYDFTGDTFKLAPNGDDLTLSDVIILAVKTPNQADTAMTLLQKLDLARIGKAVYNDTGNFSAEQIEMIKERISLTLNAPALALAVNDAFEGVPPVIKKEVPVVTNVSELTTATTV